MSRRRQGERYWVHSDPEAPTVERAASHPEALPCPGRCNTGWRHAERAARNEAARAAAAGDSPDLELVDHGRTPRPGEPVWCRNCQTDIATAIGRLPELAANVGERRDGRLNVAAGVNDVPSHTTGSHSPSGSPAWDTVDEAITWAVDTANILALHMGHAWHSRERRDGSPAGAPDLTAATRYLTTWCTSLLALPKAERYGQQALSLAQRLTRAAGRDELVHRLDVPCQACGRKALSRDDGGSTVYCRYCRNRWPENEYEALTKVLAKELPRAKERTA